MLPPLRNHGDMEDMTNDKPADKQPDLTPLETAPEAMPETTPEAIPEEKPGRLKRLGIGLLIVAIASGGLFLGGLLLGRKQSPDLQAQLRQAETELTQTQEQLTASEDRRHLLRALTALYQASVALDQRNFGVANNHIETAAAELANLQGSGEIAPDSLAQLSQDVANTRIDVAVNLEVQRGQVLNLATRLQQLIPEDDLAPAAEPLAPEASPSP